MGGEAGTGAEVTELVAVEVVVDAVEVEDKVVDVVVSLKVVVVTIIVLVVDKDEVEVDGMSVPEVDCVGVVWVVWVVVAVDTTVTKGAVVVVF